MLNYDLARRRNLSPFIIEEIEQAQSVRDGYAQMCLDGKVSKEDFNKWYTANEFYLQSLWGFPLDANYHMFWNLPGCTCPKIDNYDSWGTVYHIVASDCPLHGGMYEKAEASVPTD